MTGAIQVQLFDGGAKDGDEPILQRSLHEDDGVAWMVVWEMFGGVQDFKNKVGAWVWLY